MIDSDELDIEGFCTEGVEGREGVGEGDGGVVTHILYHLLAFVVWHGFARGVAKGIEDRQVMKDTEKIGQAELYLCAVVATNFATVCARVEYGLT